MEPMLVMNMLFKLQREVGTKAVRATSKLLWDLQLRKVSVHMLVMNALLWHRLLRMYLRDRQLWMVSVQMMQAANKLFLEEGMDSQ